MTVHQVVDESIQRTQSPMTLDDARAIISSAPVSRDWLSLTNYAASQYLLGDIYLALDYAQRAVSIERNTSTLYNLAVILEAFGRFDEVRPLAEEVHAADPENHTLTNIYAETLLRDGEWRRGWAIYVLSYVLDSPLHKYIPRWNGRDSLRGKRLLMLQNGGMGDAFLFSRWFARLKSWGAHITYAGPDTLTPLMVEQSYIDRVIPTHGPDQIIDHIDFREYDYITTVMETAYNLDVTLDDVLWRGAYITPSLGPDVVHLTRPLVGICWEAGEYIYPRRRRSITESQRDRILACSSVDWVNLQYGEPLPSTRNPDISGWSKTAAVVSQLDLVVSVDTSTAHLAGSMNIPVWVPLCGASAGLYLRNTDRVPYYPSMRLFRNRGYGIDNAVDSLVEALKEL